VTDALSDAALTADDVSPSWPAEVLRFAQDDTAGIRDAARRQFPAARLAAWRDSLAASANEFARSLATKASVDLLESFAAPWSTALAAEATGLSCIAGSELTSLARTIFLDAARMTQFGERRDGEAAVSLATALARRAPSARLDVQSFVALSQTLPHLLVAVWHALLTNRAQIQIWTSLIDKANAIDELLRNAGPSRAVFRRARQTTRCDTATIDAGQHVTIMLGDANFDASVFSNPHQLDLNRPNASRHVALGAGRHPCLGAPIIRLAVEAATNALLARAGERGVIEDVEWLDGFAIHAPTSLVVRLS